MLPPPQALGATTLDRTIPTLTAAEIGARIERLPFSAWHVRLISVVGIAHLLDAFDSVSIALVLPVLIGLWHLTPSQIGILISVGYVGQALGAMGLSWLAERIGRMGALRIALGIMAVLSFSSAFAGSYMALLTLRAVQGLGLGGEVPVAATLVNELTPARIRGRIIGSLQCLFGTGILVTSVVALWIIPNFGWQAMFYVGALPAILMCVIHWVVPELPRWLAFRGNLPAADAALKRMETAISKKGARPLPAIGPARPLPVLPRGKIADLFGPDYALRTFVVWIIMLCVSTVGYALVTWLPTIYRTAYHVTLTNTYLLTTLAGVAGLAGAIIGVCIIDIVGRRYTFMIAFFGSACPLAILGLAGDRLPIAGLIVLLTLGNLFIAVALSGVHTYATEIYPTRMRALGAGTAMAWLRIASIVSPLIIGTLLGDAGAGAVFLFLAAIGGIGGITVALGAIETKGRVLEDIAV